MGDAAGGWWAERTRNDKTRFEEEDDDERDENKHQRDSYFINEPWDAHKLTEETEILFDEKWMFVCSLHRNKIQYCTATIDIT